MPAFEDSRPAFNEGRIAGVYVLIFVGSGRYYIGSTSHLYRRLAQHENHLHLGTHFHDNLQREFELSPQLVIRVQRTDCRESAYDLEQDLLDRYLTDRDCLNKSGDARVSFKGSQHSDLTKRLLSNLATGRKMSDLFKAKISLAMTGRIVSEETRGKIAASKVGIERPDHVKDILRDCNEARSRKVSAGGVVYSSVNAAAKALGVDNRTVENRARSTTGRFDDWFFI